jgi:hypothetical protein
MPEIRPQNSAAVERVTGKHIENRQQEIQQTKRKKKPRDNVRAERIKRRHQNEKKDREQETRRRSRDGDAKFGARCFRRVSEAGQTAERMKHDFKNLHFFHSGGDGVREFVEKNRSEEN